MSKGETRNEKNDFVLLHIVLGYFVKRYKYK